MKRNKTDILEVGTGINIISLHFIPIPDLEYVNMYGIDITELKFAETKLMNHSKELEELVKEKTQELLLAQERLIRQERLATMGQLAGSVLGMSFAIL